MMNFKKMEDGFRMILEGMGENPNREGLIDTPKRVAKMYAELMTGLSGEMRAEDILKTRFHEKYDEMIIVPDIEFASMCEHHFLPFTGKAHVAYIPGDCVVGLSKIPRVVEFYARFPQIQERMTRQIAELITDPEGIEPEGCRRGTRSFAHVYDDARCEKARCNDGDHTASGPLQDRRKDPRRIHVAHLRAAVIALREKSPGRAFAAPSIISL